MNHDKGAKAAPFHFVLMRRLAAGLAFVACALAASLTPSITDARVVDPADPAFGYSRASIRGAYLAHLTLGSDGRIFAATDIFYSEFIDGCQWSAAIASFKADGSPDTAFGSAGVVDVAKLGVATCPQTPRSAAMRGRRIVTAVQASGPYARMFVLGSDGRLDPAFGTGGMVEFTAFQQSTTPALAVQPDGRIVVAGGGTLAGSNQLGGFVARYLENGQLDATFAAGGVYFFPIGGNGAVVDPSMVALQADGKIVASTTRLRKVSGKLVRDVTMVRLRGDGVPDPTFGTAGTFADPFPGGSLTTDLRIQRNGRIVVGAMTFAADGGSATSVYRLTEDGRLDATFAQAGVASFPHLLGSGITPRIAVDSDDRIVVAGQAGSDVITSGLHLYRLLPDGNPDPGFGVAGRALLFPFSWPGPTPADLAADGDGHVYVASAGNASAGDETTGQVVVARILATGGRPAGFAAGTAVEYYNAARNHYFLTASAAEMTMLDMGITAGWTRTGAFFPVVLPGYSDPSLSPVCRFYGRPETGLDSHFYSAFPSECAQVAARFADAWIFESSNVFSVHLPNIADGTCETGTLPISRFYNRRADVNHRYVTNDSDARAMLGVGWTAEGFGPQAVVMCAPLF